MYTYMYCLRIHSRATLQAKSATGSGSKDGKNENAFAGDIFLRFKHQPQPECA